MEERASKTIEDYLLVMYVLQRDGEAVVGARLAELLGVSAPTVTNTLKRMARDGLVQHDPGKGAQLTGQGWSMAASVMRRHMLAEWMLSGLLPWSKLHDEAHRLEHAISPELEAALYESYQSPRTCPHGNPLPGSDEPAAAWRPLTTVEEGCAVIFRRVHEFGEENPHVLSFLEENGICPGGEMTVVRILPFNQTITVRVGENEVPLGFTVARYIFVEGAGSPTDRVDHP
jgi:DtxR family Mn-dependent transcriptional regulator